MYPRLSDLTLDLFGFALPIPIYSFGAMVATSFLVAGWLIGKEFDRLYAMGSLPPVKVKDAKTKRMVPASPALIVGTMVTIAIATGFIGAKLFHVLENSDAFFRDPMGMLFSSGGFTFLGGLIVGTYGVLRYTGTKGLDAWRVADAVAPALLVGYAIGRIGCHLSGDGDWGITANLAARPEWLPLFLWAETYPNNILGIDLSQAPVYPTPIYETLLSGLLAAVLWRMRVHQHQAGWLFAWYLIFAGAERLLIEQIRVNTTVSVFGMDITQAMVISTLMIALGAYLVRLRKQDAQASEDAAAEAV